MPLGLQVRMTRSVLKVELWKCWGELPLFVDFAHFYVMLSPFSEQLSLGLSSTVSSMFMDHCIIAMFMVIRYKGSLKMPLDAKFR